MKEIVLISGANGFVGQHLEKILSTNYELRLLSRNPKKNNEYKWDLQAKTIDEKALHGIHHVIHLAGANIFEKRWTDKRKKEIISSRIETAQLILQEIKKHHIQLKSFVSASAVGYYGAITTEKIFTETDSKGNDFLSDVVQLWEQAADQFSSQKIAERVVKIRTAVVFAKENSALQKIEKTVKNYIGAPLGSGDQYMPWIYIDDLCKIYEYSLSNANMNGVFNASAPQSITNKQLTQFIAQKLHRPLWLPHVPSFVLKLALGEASCMILEGSRISSEKIQHTGFNFQFKNLDTFM